jgi:Arc/MetJ-type ribon-helix-helix transcriptional regulator
MTQERQSSQNSLIKGLNTKNRCDICGSTESLSKYSLDSSPGDSSVIVLCSSHYQVAATLSGSRFQDSDLSTDYGIQETRKITVRVPRALIESADSAAEQQGKTRSELVRDGLQMAIKVQEMEEAFDDIVSQAAQSRTDTETEADVEFLRERIRTLESLLEDSIEKI